MAPLRFSLFRASTGFRVGFSILPGLLTVSLELEAHRVTPPLARFSSTKERPIVRSREQMGHSAESLCERPSVQQVAPQSCLWSAGSPPPELPLVSSLL